MLVVKNPSTNAGDVRDVDSIPGSERSPGGGHSNPFQYSCLENPMDRRAWWAIVYRVAKSQTPLKQFSTAQHDTSESYHNSYVHTINLFFCLFVLLVFLIDLYSLYLDCNFFCCCFLLTLLMVLFALTTCQISPISLYFLL